MASPERIQRWDDEADVVVLGFGLSGAVTAMTAHDTDPDADVLIVEKMPERYAGGNSRASGQTLVFPADLDKWMIYQQALNQPNPIPEDVLRAWAAERVGLEDWVRQLAEEAGLEYIRHAQRGPELIPPVPEFPDMPGAECVEFLATIRPEPSGVWKTFKAAVDRRPRIRRRFETAAYDLVQDPDTLEVIGVLVRSGGESQAIHARRAVVMCTGGFENNLQMQKDYFGLDRVYTAGTPGNTGDGVKMLTKAGADLWHMRNRNQSGGFWPAMKVPEYDSAFMKALEFTGASFIEIAKDNNRFYDEAFRYASTHYRLKDHGIWIDTFHFRMLPVHLIFDEAFRPQQRLTLDRAWMSWNLTVENYQWSADNSAEIAKGWITQADTIEELANKIGRDPAAVAATISRFNQYAEAGSDPEYGRDPVKMAPIAKPPFYAVEIVPAIVCSTGGGVRDARSQVVSTTGTPIPRLYEAGELGSTHGNLYQNGSFLTECMGFGKIAGRNAVAERARDSIKSLA